MQTQATLRQFARANNTLAYSILIADLSLYISSVVAAVVVDSLLLKFLFALAAGFFIAQLFVIGHDAGHAAYVSSRRANALIARLCFIPSLHNYSLWLFIHNRLHHGFPNVKNYNSWSPLSHDEYLELPGWRRLLERLYRSPAGFGIYYLCERWLKDKFFPRQHIPQKFHRQAWWDFTVNMTCQFSLIAGIVFLARLSSHEPLESVLFAVVIPFLVWNTAMGFTIYQHHTHPGILWYRTLVESRESSRSQADVTIYIKYPHWYEFITHYIYVHPVHHMNARIPLYHLRKAQEAYTRSQPTSTLVEQFSIRGLFRTSQACKLYDYTRHQWLDFNGTPTTLPLVTSTESTQAEVIPLRQSAGN